MSTAIQQKTRIGDDRVCKVENSYFQQKKDALFSEVKDSVEMEILSANFDAQCAA